MENEHSMKNGATELLSLENTISRRSPGDAFEELGSMCHEG